MGWGASRSIIMNDADAMVAAEAAPGVSLGMIFRTFLTAGAISFGGGVVAYLRDFTVTETKWLDDDAFLDALEISQTLPGLNAVNMSVIIGDNLRGIPGAIAAVLGLVLPGVIVIMGLGAAWQEESQNVQVRMFLIGVAAAAVGLLSTVTGEFVRMLPQDERSMSVPPAFTPDGRTLVTVIGGLIQFWEVATGGEIAVRKPSDDIVRALFISADSLRVATASPDDTILVWDLAHLMTNNPPTAIPLGTLWNDLASADAASGRRAVEMLSMVPTDAVPLLRARIKPVPHATAQQITRWIADLGSDDFEVRQQAEKELDRRNDAAGAALRDALAGNPSLEMRRRVEGLLKNLEQYSLSSEQLRVVRAEQVLEMIGSPEAQAVLETLAAGAPGAGETREAAAALQRLKQR